MCEIWCYCSAGTTTCTGRRRDKVSIGRRSIRAFLPLAVQPLLRKPGEDGFWVKMCKWLYGNTKNVTLL